MLRSIVAGFVMLLAACAPLSSRVPANVSTGAVALPSPQPAANDAPPRMLAIAFSSLDVARPGWWSGRIVTTTNVASVELRTNQFSISVPRRDYGDFAFRVRVLDLPAEFLRRYDLHVIARNSAGVAVEEEMPLRIR